MNRPIEHAAIGAHRGLQGYFRRKIAEAKLKDAMLTPAEKLEAKLNREVLRQRRAFAEKRRIR